MNDTKHMVIKLPKELREKYKILYGGLEMPTDDIRRIFQRLDTIDCTLARIDATVTRLDRAVNGNGKPGLLDRTTVIEERQSSCPARDAYKGDTKRANTSNLIALAAVLIALLSMLN